MAELNVFVSDHNDHFYFSLQIPIIVELKTKCGDSEMALYYLLLCCIFGNIYSNLFGVAWEEAGTSTRGHLLITFTIYTFIYQFSKRVWHRKSRNSALNNKIILRQFRTRQQPPGRYNKCPLLLFLTSLSCTKV